MRAICDAMTISDICDPARSSLNFHLIQLHNCVFQDIIGRLYWLDIRDIVADALIRGGIDR